MSDQHDSWRFRTRAIHVGNARDPATGAIVPPIHVASTFVQAEAGKWSQFDYSRSGNPTRQQVETTIANLEGGYVALHLPRAWPQTHAATMLLSAGDHIVAGTDIYGGTYRLFHKIIQRSGHFRDAGRCPRFAGRSSSHHATHQVALD